jgi:acyl-CoA synthetase (AMP-forming)/AMP-acid ligase II
VTSELTIPELLAHNSLAHGSLAALVSDDESITHAELDDGSAVLATRLVAAGVNKGDRVALLAPNGIEWATIALGVMRIGAVLVPLSTLLRPPELVAQLATASVTHLVAARECRGRSYVDELEAEVPDIGGRLADGGRHPTLPFLKAVWTADAIPEAAAPDAIVQALGEVVRPADDLAILFTSGSRGTPKGVIHTHDNALRATRSGLAARCVGEEERLYIPMPFFWMGGFGGGLLTVVVAGATLLTESTPEPASTLALLEREKVTLFRGWPDQAAALAAHPDFADADLSSLGPASLGPVLPPDQRAAPGARANLFGMTESFGPYCGDRLDTDMPADKYGSCGRPFDGVEVRITDPSTGEPVPAGTEGEIQLRGPNLMRGLCGRMRSDVFTVDGYYPTGDLGRLDEDGYLWYSGRVDDMFKVKGATVYPSEVEVALRSLPGVALAHVTNITSAEGHDQVAALVVSGNDANALSESVRERLSSFKVPTVWLVVEDREVIPMMASGKVDKGGLQQLLLESGTSVDRPAATGAEQSGS